MWKIITNCPVPEFKPVISGSGVSHNYLVLDQDSSPKILFLFYFRLATLPINFGSYVKVFSYIIQWSEQKMSWENDWLV